MDPIGNCHKHITFIHTLIFPPDQRRVAGSEGETVEQI